MNAACRLGALALAVVAATSAHAATLRPMTTLHASVVRLQDLFDQAGPLASRVLGPAPAPGERIVVPSRQLAAIARMFGVDWHPASPADMAVLERPGRLLPRDVVVGTLRPALAGVGAPTDCDILLTSYAAPMIPLQTAVQASVEQLEYDAASHGFAAALLVTGADMLPLRLRLSGRVEPMATVLVPTHTLFAGTVLRAGDLTTQRVRASLLRGDMATDAGQSVGMTLRRTMRPGVPVPLADLAAPGSVDRGARVLLRVAVGGLTAATQGIVLAPAAPGEPVQVLNPLSHVVVEGLLQADGTVSVAPDSLPMPASASMLLQASLP